jgi:hypothetical protein
MYPVTTGTTRKCPTNVIPTPIELPCVIFGIEAIVAGDGPRHPRAGEVIDGVRIRETVRITVVGVPVHLEVLLSGLIRDALVDDVDTRGFVVVFLVTKEL